MQRLRILVTGVALLGLCAASARAVEILVPRDKAVVAEDSLVVLGTAPKGTTVPWTLRGPKGSGPPEQGDARADWGDLFEIFLILDPGINRLRVGDRDLEVFCAAEGGTPPPGFLPQRVHAGDISRCQDCHETRTLRLVDDGYPGVCLGCHIVVPTNPKFQGAASEDKHFATAVRDCGNCHEAHTGTRPKLLRGAPGELCGKCHPEKEKAEKVHAAAGSGGCAACHDPHFSGYPKTLRMPVPGVCQQCHEQGTETSPRGLHQPLEQDRSCGHCHDPHAPMGRDTCSSCHGQVMARGHKGELRRCGECHDPHRALGTGLLRGETDKVCLDCHPEVSPVPKGHATLGKGCAACHDPHSEANREEARGSCGRCHDLKASKALNGLHGDLSIRPESCNRCHASHGSSFGTSFRGKLHPPVADGKCALCHGGGEERSTVVEEQAARCRLCHPLEGKLREEGAILHAPVAAGGCTQCHDPHMSNQKALLKAPEREGCHACHPRPPGGEGPNLHRAAEICTNCHAPHGSARAHLLRNGKNALCRRCHAPDKKHHTLDTEKADKYPGASSFPRDGDELDCLGCHAPHASRFAALLSGPREKLCTTCHDPGR